MNTKSNRLEMLSLRHQQASYCDNITSWVIADYRCTEWLAMLR